MVEKHKVVAKWYQDGDQFAGGWILKCGVVLAQAGEKA
jgi:hypothetical protein